MPKAWSHPGLCLTAKVHSLSQTWEVRPSPSDSTELMPPLGGYFNPKLEVPHREDMCLSAFRKTQYTVGLQKDAIYCPKPVFFKILGSNKWAGK